MKDIVLICCVFHNMLRKHQEVPSSAEDIMPLQNEHVVYVKITEVVGGAVF